VVAASSAVLTFLKSVLLYTTTTTTTTTDNRVVLNRDCPFHIIVASEGFFSPLWWVGLQILKRCNLLGGWVWEK